MGTYHSPLIVLLFPFMITFPLYRTSTSIPHFWKNTSHLALHSRTTDNREYLIPGSTCAFLAPAGSPSTSMKPLCVLLIFSPFATVTSILSVWGQLIFGLWFTRLGKKLKNQKNQFQWHTHDLSVGC